MRRSEERLPARRGQDWGLTRGGDQDLFSPTSSFGSSPWHAMRRMQEDMDRLFGQFFNETLGASGRSAMQQWHPNMDISQSDREWCIEAELPGVNKDDIDVQVRDGHLILRAEMREQSDADEGKDRQYHHRERRYGFFERVVPLPQNVDEEHIACDFQNGVLTLHLPKMEQAAPAARRIPITAGKTQGGLTLDSKQDAAPSKGGRQGEETHKDSEAQKRAA